MLGVANQTITVHRWIVLALSVVLGLLKWVIQLWLLFDAALRCIRKALELVNIVDQDLFNDLLNRLVSFVEQELHIMLLEDNFGLESGSNDSIHLILEQALIAFLWVLGLWLSALAVFLLEGSQTRWENSWKLFFYFFFVQMISRFIFVRANSA